MESALRLGALATPATRRQSLPIQAVPSVAAHARQCRAQLLLTAALFLVDVLAKRSRSEDANVDFAMSIKGTRIAKDAANIIQRNDNLTCIVVVAKWKRNVFSSMQGFPQFQLTVSTAILLLNAICACISVLCLLTGLHLLWLSLILDSVDSVALALDPPTDELLEVSLQHLFCKGA